MVIVSLVVITQPVCSGDSNVIEFITVKMRRQLVSDISDYTLKNKAVCDLEQYLLQDVMTVFMQEASLQALYLCQPASTMGIM